MAPRAPKRPPRWPATAQEASKPQDGPGELRDAQHGLEDGPKAPQGGPKSAQRAPRRQLSTGARNALRLPKALRLPQDISKMCREAPKMAQDGLKIAYDGP
eukprot:1025215-Pyramimonas_sp.AAC.1